MNHLDDMLDLSRQIARGPLWPWLAAGLRRQVESGLFLSSNDLGTVGDGLIKQLSGALRWFERDYNVMPTDLDVYKPERWINDALFRPEVREAYRRLVAPGWTDALRQLHPEERIYTFWDYFRNAFNRDAGLRIDHLLLSPSLAPRLRAAGVDRQVRSWEKTSDHAPTWVELGTVHKAARRRSVR